MLLWGNASAARAKWKRENNDYHPKNTLQCHELLKNTQDKVLFW